MCHVWHLGWAACVDGAAPRAFRGAQVGAFVSNEETGGRAYRGSFAGSWAYLVLADVGFIEKRLERARGERAHRSLIRVAEERGARGVEEKGVRGVFFLSIERRSDVFARSENEATCGGASVVRRGVRGDRGEGRPEGRRTLLNSASACCSTSRSPKFRGGKACGMRRSWRGGKRRVAVRCLSPEKAPRAVACPRKPRIEGAPRVSDVRKRPRRTSATSCEVDTSSAAPVRPLAVSASTPSCCSSQGRSPRAASRSRATSASEGAGCASCPGVSANDTPARMGSRLRYCDTARTAATPHVASADPARKGDSPAPNP